MSNFIYRRWANSKFTIINENLNRPSLYKLYSERLRMKDHEFINLILHSSIPQYIKSVLILQVIYDFIKRTFINISIEFIENTNDEYVFIQMKHYKIECGNNNLLFIKNNNIKEIIEFRDLDWKIKLDKLIGAI